MTPQTHIPFSHQQCSFKAAITPHTDHPHILQYVCLKAIHPTRGVVGEIRALQIHRNRCEGDLHEIMDEESRELIAFASTLFDKYGRLREELIKNECLKGTGVWWRELDEGILLYIFNVTVKERVADLLAYIGAFPLTYRI